MLKDHFGREVNMQKIGPRAKYWVEDKYVVIVPRNTPLCEVIMILEKPYG